MIVQTIDRSLTEYLRRQTVALGFIPDITAYVDAATYKQAKEDLKVSNNLQTIIEIYGVGAAEPRDEKSNAKVFVDRASIDTGTVGGWPEEFYTLNIDGTWNKYKMPDMSYDVMYEIRTVTDNTQVDRTMDSIVRRCFGSRKYIKFVDSNGNDTLFEFLILFKGMVDVSNNGYLERVYKYEVNQVWLDTPELLAANIPPLTSYDANIIPTDLIVVPEPPPPPPTCQVAFAGIGLNLIVSTLTVTVGMTAITGLSRLVLLVRNSFSGFSPIQEILVPIDNVSTDFSFEVNMLPYPTEFYVFQVQAFTTCDEDNASTSIDSDPTLAWTEIPKSFDVTEFAFAPDGGGNLAIQVTIANESRVSAYQVLYRQDQNPMTPFYPVAQFNYDANANGIYNMILNVDFNTSNILYFVVLGTFDDVTSQQDDQGNNSPEAVVPNPTYFQFDNRPPAEQLIYGINTPQKLSIEEWELSTPPVAGYTYKIEFAAIYGNSKFVDQNGTLSSMLFIDGSNWYNPRIMWDHAGIDTQTVSAYVQMTIYGPTGVTVCGLSYVDFTNIVVLSAKVMLRGGLLGGGQISLGKFLDVYAYGSPEYFTEGGVNIGKPNPYGNIKAAQGFTVDLGNSGLRDVIKIELREENEDQNGPSEAVVDFAFAWCKHPSVGYEPPQGINKVVDFLTTRNEFIAFNAYPNVEYYVVIKHRNHLAVSSKKFLLSTMGNVTDIDFTTYTDALNTGGSEFYEDIYGFLYMQYGNAHDQIGDVGEVNATDEFLVNQDNGVYVGYSDTAVNLATSVGPNDVAIATEGSNALYYSGVSNPSLL